ncbi:hypothetical protein J6E39_01885 [bacterium]|nr:hypothetical protein [bacterium]
MKYPNEKVKIIQSFEDKYIINFLDEIKNGPGRSCLIKILSPFVPTHLKHESDNSKKFGLETKERFCKALKGIGRFTNSTNRKKTLPENGAFEMLSTIYSLFMETNSEFSLTFIEEYISLKKIEKSNFDIGDIDFLKFLIKKNKEFLISKETIDIFYNFGPIIPSPELNKLIHNCKTRLDIIEHLHKSQTSHQEIVQYEAKLNHKDELISSLNQEIEDKNLELDFYQEENNKLQKQIKQFEHTNIDKMKQNFEKQLSKKEIEIDELKAQLEDYDEIVSQNEKLQVTNKTLEQYRKLDIRDFHAQMENKEFRKFLKHLILSDEKTSKLVIRMLNLKEELLLEADKLYEQKFIDVNIELEELNKQKEQLLIDISSMETQKSSYVAEKGLNFNQGIYQKASMMLIDDEEFKEEFRFELNKAENDYDFKLHEKLKHNNVIIVEDKKDIAVWLKCQKFGCNPLEVIVEYDWTSYSDWFGFFDTNNKFIPSNTLVADYYKSIKLNPNLPFGIVIFNDFNKILPEIYLEPFFQNLEVKGFLDLIHPDTDVKKEYEVFKRIEFLNNLKFVFVKSKSKDAFDIPITFKKYEVF